MNEFELYKYLTTNDPNIVLLKEHVHEILLERSLSSMMSDTKWLELQKGIESLPFPPAYLEKLVHVERKERVFGDFKKEPSYYGDWSSFWLEGMPIFFTIEWLEIRPFFAEYQGRLVPPKITNETEELLDLLHQLKLPFEQFDRSIVIFGYR